MPPRHQAFRRGRGVLQRAHELGARQLWELRSHCDEQVTFRDACTATRKIGLRLPSVVNSRSALPAFSRKVRIFSYKNKVHCATLRRNNFPSVMISKGHTMQEKYTYGLWGAAADAAALAIVGFSWGGWSTAGGTARQVEAAIQTAMIPGCVKDVMADSTAAAELKVKRPTDYDDVVRDYRKRTNYLSNLTYQFNRDCGKAMEAVMAKMATKS